MISFFQGEFADDARSFLKIEIKGGSVKSSVEYFSHISFKVVLS
jgi:hypothetical protein